MKFAKDSPEIRLRLVLDLRFVRGLPKICMRFSQDSSEIFLKFPEICQKFFWDFPESYLIFGYLSRRTQSIYIKRYVCEWVSEWVSEPWVSNILFVPRGTNNFHTQQGGTNIFHTQGGGTNTFCWRRWWPWWCWWRDGCERSELSCKQIEHFYERNEQALCRS